MIEKSVPVEPVQPEGVELPMRDGWASNLERVNFARIALSILLRGHVYMTREFLSGDTGGGSMPERKPSEDSLPFTLPAPEVEPEPAARPDARTWFEQLCRDPVEPELPAGPLAAGATFSEWLDAEMCRAAEQAAEEAWARYERAVLGDVKNGKLTGLLGFLSGDTGGGSASAWPPPPPPGSVFGMLVRSFEPEPEGLAAAAETPEQVEARVRRNIAWELAKQMQTCPEHSRFESSREGCTTCARNGMVSRCCRIATGQISGDPPRFPNPRATATA
ncbi:hypothetical protein [Streptosporangium roseum]|uniref:hypothetical protein n=1 Tax=Streptosporangium roseum TaxID=2001 RepID=UPI00331F00F4